LRPSPTYALVEKHLPAEYRSKFIWRHLAGLLKRVAEGQQDVSEVSIALKIVLQLEGVKADPPLPYAVGYRRIRPKLLHRSR